METGDLEIVKATTSDSSAIAQILVKSWQAAYRGIMSDEVLDNLSLQQREEVWRKHLNSGGEAYLLRLSGETVGVIEVCKFRDSIEGFSGWGEIPVIYLLPESYGSGLGSELMRFALALLTERGEGNIGIWVLEKNTRAIHFYKKHGFSQSEHNKVHKPTGLVEILMVRYSGSRNDRY